MARVARRLVRPMARACFVLAALGVAPLGVAPLAAQDRTVDGRITRPGPTPAGLGVGGAWVVLHRVGTDAAGPLDSMRTAASGGYAFRYRATGDSNAVYFVSTSRGGVSYFTPPLRERAVRGGLADILVFDTTSAPIPIKVMGRHLIVTIPDSSTQRTRTVVEAYELANDSSVTRIARGADGVTFDAALPPGVTQVRAGQGDISDDAIRAIDGRLSVNAPLSPGLRQLTFSYEIPADTDPFELLVEKPTTVLEVLVEEPTATVEGAGILAVDPVEIDGRPFRRFLARDVAAAQVVTIRIPRRGVSSTMRIMLVVTAVGAAMLFGLGAVLMRRGPGMARPRNDDPESLATQVAALDAAFEAIDAPSDAQKAEHYMVRAQLKGRLAAALAKRDGLS